MSEITLNITLQGSYMYDMINMNVQIILFPLPKLIDMTIVSYQSAIMSEITLNRN